MFKYFRLREYCDFVSGEYNLFIENAQLEDDGEYECQIAATAEFPGRASQKAQLTVNGVYVVLCTL